MVPGGVGHFPVFLVGLGGAVALFVYSWTSASSLEECHVTIETVQGEKHRFVAEPEEAERYLGVLVTDA